LGIVSISPVQMARAYATIANRGRAVEPLAIRYIEDRNGAEIINPERDLRGVQARDNLQVMTPQEAYIMVSLLRSTVEWGTLNWPRIVVDGFDGMPMAGKTGTVQNWTDAWTCGFSPYYTTILWAGFDERGNSLGVNQTGATATGPVWAKYMKAIHEDLPVKEFSKPETGLIEMEVSALTGKLVPEGSDEPTITEIFLEGTEPREFSDYGAFIEERDRYLESKLLGDLSLQDVAASPFLDVAPSLDLLLEDLGLDITLDPITSDGGSSSASSSLLD
jgi:penicillin-binding protein 1A